MSGHRLEPDQQSGGLGGGGSTWHLQLQEEAAPGNTEQGGEEVPLPMATGHASDRSSLAGRPEVHTPATNATRTLCTGERVCIF